MVWLVNNEKWVVRLKQTMEETTMTKDQQTCWECESKKFCYECRLKDVVIK